MNTNLFKESDEQFQGVSQKHKEALENEVNKLYTSYSGRKQLFSKKHKDALIYLILGSTEYLLSNKLRLDIEALGKSKTPEDQKNQVRARIKGFSDQLIREYEISIPVYLGMNSGSQKAELKYVFSEMKKRVESIVYDSNIFIVSEDEYEKLCDELIRNQSSISYNIVRTINKISSEYLKLVASIWSRYIVMLEWPTGLPFRTEHGREMVNNALKELAPRFIIHNNQSPDDKYQLTLLGIFAIGGLKSRNIKNLLLYLYYMKGKFRVIESKFEIESEELRYLFSLSQEDIKELGLLLNISYYFTGSGNHATDYSQWKYEIPSMIEDLNETKNVCDFLLTYLDNLLKKKKSSRSGEAESTIWEEIMGQNKNSPVNTISVAVEFIQDESIKEIVQRDISELNKMISLNCCKGILILTGSIIEAILLDLLMKNSTKMRDAKTKKSTKLEVWTLENLIDVSEELGLIDFGVKGFSHSLRHYRNLIHPGKEIRDKLTIASEEANIAIQVLKILIRQLNG
ncbi:hypothetical protein KAU32_02740 [bacterium]|nr:hypothetical protein [bacterium]